MNKLALLLVASLAVPSLAHAQAADAPLTAVAPPPLECTGCRAVETTGLATFAVSYGVMVYEFASVQAEVYGASSSELWLPPEFVTVLTAPMLVPVAGPVFTMLLTHDEHEQRLLALDAGVQLAGLGVAYAGSKMEDDWRIRVAPVPTRGGAGMVGAMSF